MRIELRRSARAPRGRRRWLALAALAGFLFVAGIPSTALALDLETAKGSGWIGEQLDGYVGTLSGAPADALALAASINAERRGHYAAIAQKNGTDVAVVAALAGRKLTARAPPGHWVQSASGAWTQK